MLERTIRPVLKTGVLHGTVGSNPTPSANHARQEQRYQDVAFTPAFSHTGTVGLTTTAQKLIRLGNFMPKG